MLPLQEISDRLEIQDLLARYCDAVDRQDWDAFERIFTPDAVIDYSAMGGSSGGVAVTKKFLADTMPMFASFQHLVGSTVLDLEGDTARARTICHNPMVWRDGDDPAMFVCGLWYRDELVRTAAGWRIRLRVEERSYMKNLSAARPTGQGGRSK
jgi:ketosteroid isomerase-like protein